MNKVKKVAFATLGCKVNAYDSQALMEIFEAAGYEIVEFSKPADIYVINTCTVTHTGDRKSRNMLRKARRLNPKAIICALGCYVQVAPEEIEKIEAVDLMIGTKNRKEILHYIEKFTADREKHNFVSNIMTEKTFEPLEISDTKGKTRAFIKIQEGCNRFCTYCIIPYARGPIRSRAFLEVLDEIKRLVAAGYQEVVLTGIHIASYGLDQGQQDLLDLLVAADQIKDLKRIRLGSMEPMFLNQERLKRLKELRCFCPHFHLSLQSGSDSVLKRMGRRYKTAEYAAIVQMIRRDFPLAAITTDIMVGFPGETEAEFMETLEFVKEIEFYQIHIFKYSKRRGTPAATYKNQVDGTIKNSRAERLKELMEKQEQAFLKKNDGTVKEVLIESFSKEFAYEGHTKNYLPVKVMTDQKINGKIIMIKLSYKNEGYLAGSVVKGGI